MVFKLVLNYEENEDKRNNLVQLMDDGLKNETFSYIFDYLKTIRLITNEQKIMKTIWFYINDYLNWLKEERKAGQGRPLPGQMEIEVYLFDEDGTNCENLLREYNSTYGRPIVNLEKKVKEFIKQEKSTDNKTGKQTIEDVLKIVVAYVPTQGRDK